MDEQVCQTEIPRNKKTAKREQAKTKILNATLDLIASKGLCNLSHRTIAKAAGVQLAMTTYYFGTIENIIEEAFDHYVAETQPFRDAIEAQTRSLLLQHSQRTDHENFPQPAYYFLQALAELITEHIVLGVNSRSRHLAIECQFVFQQNATEAMKAKVQALNEVFINLITPTCRELGSTAPEIDAQLMVHVIRQFELTSVNAGEEVNRPLLNKTIYRLISGLYLHSQQASNSEQPVALTAD